MSNTIDLKDILTTYGTHTLKMKCSAANYVDSGYNEETIDYEPYIYFDANYEKIIFTHVLPSVTSYELYGDSTLLGSFTVSLEDNDDIVIDLADLNILAFDYAKYKIKVNINSTIYYSNEVYSAKVFGVSGLYDSSSALTRTNAAVGMTFAVNSSTGEISSDFDNEFPYNEMTRVTIGDNVFVKVPAMWFRIGTDSNSNLTDIAVSSVRSNDGGNWFHTDEFYYGAYKGSVQSNTLYSRTGASPRFALATNVFRSDAKRHGTDYGIIDIYHLTILRFLFLIEYATKDSVSVMLGRSMSGGSYIYCGGTDNIATPSGFNVSTNQMKYRYIEDFYGNGLELFDGIYLNKGTSVLADMGTFDNYNDISYNFRGVSSGYTKALGWDSNNPFICMPKETGGTATTYMCDRYSNNGGNTLVACAFGTDFSYYNNDEGLFYTETNSNTSFNFSTITSRLMYYPNN